MKLLQGYRTYIVVALGLIYLIAENQHWLAPIPGLGSALTLAAMGFLRAAVKDQGVGSVTIPNPADPGAQQASGGSPPRPTLDPVPPSYPNNPSTIMKLLIASLLCASLFAVTGCAGWGKIFQGGSIEVRPGTNGTPVIDIGGTIDPGAAGLAIQARPSAALKAGVK